MHIDAASHYFDGSLTVHNNVSPLRRPDAPTHTHAFIVHMQQDMALCLVKSLKDRQSLTDQVTSKH